MKPKCARAFKSNIFCSYSSFPMNQSISQFNVEIMKLFVVAFSHLQSFHTTYLRETTRYSASANTSFRQTVHIRHPTHVSLIELQSSLRTPYHSFLPFVSGSAWRFSVPMHGCPVNFGGHASLFVAIKKARAHVALQRKQRTINSYPFFVSRSCNSR